MSQHIYKYEEEKITVAAGWDRPLGYLFLIIENERDRKVHRGFQLQKAGS